MIKIKKKFLKRSKKDRDKKMIKKSKNDKKRSKKDKKEI